MDVEKIFVVAVETDLDFLCVDCCRIVLVVVVDSSGDGANEWVATKSNIATKHTDCLEIFEYAAIIFGSSGAGSWL